MLSGVKENVLLCSLVILAVGNVASSKKVFLNKSDNSLININNNIDIDDIAKYSYRGNLFVEFYKFNLKP